jgi:hypothetical protein
MEAGPSTATSLAELADIRPGFEGVGQSWVQLLSHQTSLGHPIPLAALMLQRTLPHTHLTATEVRLLWEYSGVIATCPLDRRKSSQESRLTSKPLHTYLCTIMNRFC